MGSTTEGARYPGLREMARRLMRRQPWDHTLDATGLAHEAWMRLEQAGGWPEHAGAWAAAAATMRSVLVDHARRRAARGSRDRSRTSPLAQRACYREDPAEDMLALDEALGRLAANAPARARIVELRFFAGLDVAETAAEMGCSTATVKREWRLARVFLRQQIAGSALDED